MRTKNFINNALSAALLQIITMMVGFVIPRLILKSYGSEMNGLVNSILQFISFFSLVESGLAGAAVYALYKPIADQDIKGINSILTASRNYYVRTGMIFVSLVLILSFFYPSFVSSTYLSNFEVGLLVVVLGLTGTIDFFLMAKYRVLLTASQKFYILSFSSIFHIILNTIFIVTLSYFGFHITILYSAASISVLLRSVFLHIYVKKKYNYVSYKEEPNYKALDKQFDVLILQILGSFRVGTPILVATIFTSLTTISVYTVYNMIFLGVNGVLSIFTSGISASFGDVIVRGEKSAFQKAYREFEYGYYIVIAWVYSCTLILIMPFISIYTAGINDAEYILPILGFMFVVNGLLQNLKTPQGMLVIAAGKYRETRVQSIIQGAIGLIASVVLVQSWGLIGILGGMCVAEFYRLIDLLFYIPRNITHLKVSSTIFRLLRVILIIALCYIPFTFIRLKPGNYTDWISNALIVSIFCFIVTIFLNFIFERQLFKDLLYRIHKIIKLRGNN